MPGDDIPRFLRVPVARLVRAFAPARIVLFGSYAAGSATPASDVDLLVIADIVGESEIPPAQGTSVGRNELPAGSISSCARRRRRTAPTGRARRSCSRSSSTESRSTSAPRRGSKERGAARQRLRSAQGSPRPPRASPGRTCARRWRGEHTGSVDTSPSGDRVYPAAAEPRIRIVGRFATSVHGCLRSPGVSSPNHGTRSGHRRPKARNIRPPPRPRVAEGRSVQPRHLVERDPHRFARGVCDLGCSGVAGAGRVDRDGNIRHLPNHSALTALVGPRPSHPHVKHRIRGPSDAWRMAALLGRAVLIVPPASGDRRISVSNRAGDAAGRATRLPARTLRRCATVLSGVARRPFRRHSLRAGKPATQMIDFASRRLGLWPSYGRIVAGGMKWDSPRTLSTKLGQHGPSLQLHVTNGRRTSGSLTQSVSTPRRWSFGNSFSGLGRRDQVPMRSPPQLPDDASRPMAMRAFRESPRHRHSPAPRITAAATRNTNRSASPGTWCCQMVSRSSSVGRRRRSAVASLRRRRRHRSSHLPIQRCSASSMRKSSASLKRSVRSSRSRDSPLPPGRSACACRATTAWTPTSFVRR